MQQLLLPTDSLFTDRPAVSLDEARGAHCRGAVVFPRQTDSLPETADTICRVYHQDKFLMLGQVRELDKERFGSVCIQKTSDKFLHTNRNGELKMENG